MLGQLQDAILDHFEYMLNDMGITEIPNGRFVLCPTLDETDHFKMLERQVARANDDAQVKLPFAVAARGQYGTEHTQRLFYVKNTHARDITVGDRNAGEISVIRAAPIKMLYTYIIYASTPDFLDLVLEKWLLAANRGYTAFEYTPTELGGTEALKANVVFGDIDTAMNGIDDNRDRGTYFSLQVPIEIETVLTTAIGETRQVILDSDTHIDLDVEVIRRQDDFPGE